MKRVSNVNGAVCAAVSTAALLAGAGPALADGDIILNMRLRAETVDLSGAPNEAEALTLRTRLGYESDVYNGFSFLVEGENVLHLVDDFNDTINGLPGYPVIADPEATELNRLQVSYSGFEDTNLILGRQRIILGDARYVGNVGFRQNEQTFDAFVASNGSLENTTFTYAYIDRAHRIFGDDHPAGELDMQTHALMASHEMQAGTLTGFAFLADVEDVAALSSATYGASWRGRHEFGEGVSFGYFLEYAWQTDYADAPRDFDLSMIRAEASLSRNGLSGAIGIEQLEGDGVQGFSTPLATLHKFQGWADVFLATPGVGVRDAYLRGSYRFDEVPFGTGLSAAIVYHDFESETGSIDFGSELDFVITSTLTEHVSVQLKAASFDGEAGGPASRDKVWLALTFNR